MNKKNKFGITYRFIPSNNESKNEQIKYDLISLEPDKFRILASVRTEYYHFTSLDNALNILKNKQMKAKSIKSHKKEKESYNEEVADRKFSISFSHNLNEQQEKGMFNAFADKNKGCKITFEINKNEEFKDSFLKYNEYVYLFDSNFNKYEALLCIEKEGNLTAGFAKEKNPDTIIRAYFADANYTEEITNENNIMLGCNILNKPQPLNMKYSYQNETVLTFTIDKISKVMPQILNEIEYIMININIEKMQSIKIEFGNLTTKEDRNNFIEEINKLNYNNIEYIN